MKLGDHFKQFLGNISLNPQREDRINSARAAWENLLKNDEELKDQFLDFRLQGSYAIRAAIKPKDGDEFDVDTVLILALDNDMTAKETIDMLAERARSNEAYKGKIIKKSRCVRVNYAGDFHLDIVPAKPTTGESVSIPDRDSDEWVSSNPLGFVAWAGAKGPQFARVVKMVKYWRDCKVGAKSAPKSILLTTIAGNHFASKPSDAESLVTTLEQMVENLSGHLVGGVPTVDNPSLPGENLARDWDEAGFNVFKTKLGRFAEDARRALDETDTDNSIEQWRELFGGAFPKELGEAAALASKTAAGGVLVSADGRVNADSGQVVKAHRFYGAENE